MVRIIAGTAKGRLLSAPQGRHTRPTADRVREAMFSVLSAQVPGARVLDVFAGSAALGLEAMSRGAASAVFMEKDSAAAQVCAQNISKLGFANCQLLRGNSLQLLGKLTQQFDLIFIDPPYNQGLLNPIMERIAALQLLAAGGWVAVETSAKESEFSPGTWWTIAKSKVYGDTAVHYCCQQC